MPSAEQTDDDAVFARWVGVQELRLLVAADLTIGAIEIRAEGLPGEHAVLLSPNAALNLTMKIVAAVARLKGHSPPG